MMSKRFRQKLSKIGMYTLTIAVMALMFFPILWMISVSVRPLHQTFEPTLLPREIDLSSYRYIFSNQAIRRTFINSVIVATFSTLLCMIVGLPASYALSRYSFRGKKIVLTSILSAKMFPPVFLIISYFFIASKLKLYDNLISVIIVDSLITLPFMVWMMKNYFDTVPKELDEAAIIDGLSSFGVLIRIILPISSPGVAATITYCFLLTWNEFLFAFTLTASRSNRVVPVQIMAYLGEYTKDYSALLSTSLIFIVPILFLFIMMQRYLVQGLSAGAIKG